mgnify:CR=1 FL=1
MSLLDADGIVVRDGTTPLVSRLSLRLDPGEPLIVLGETGSGKSVLAQAVMGTLPRGLRAEGRVAIDGRVLDASDARGFRALWGRKIAVLPQEPWLSLDPLMRAHRQVEEALHLVRGLPARESRARARTELVALGLAGAETRYPHELSGGMAQRVSIAAARAGGARVVVADEPTKGLDTARRDEVADLLLSETGGDGGLLVITHDLALARRLGGRLMVLRAGEVVETGDTAEVFAVPRAAYTRELIAADPESWPARRSTARGGDAVVRAEGLAVARGGRTLFRDVAFEIGPGAVFGVTGPSGCGKSSLGDAVLGLVSGTEGRVWRQGRDARTFQKLYQDPVAAFPRKRPLGESIGDVARLAGVERGRIDVMLERLGLDPVLLSRRPDAVSGGELQRLALLRVLLVNPAFVFADEPTSRLDPITQASVITLLGETAERDGVAIMLVSHDGALIRGTADAVLSLGGEDGTSGTGSAPVVDAPVVDAAGVNATGAAGRFVRG